MKSPLQISTSIVTVAFSLFCQQGIAQNVGIGTSAPLDKLHVVGAVRSSTLAGVGNRAVLSDPNGTLIIGTNTGAPDWTVIGNIGTAAATNFIGTADAQDFVVKTGGAAAVNERMRFFTAGQAIYNRTLIQAGDVFSVYGNGYTSVTNNTLGDWAINGYVNSAVGGAVYGENASGVGVLGNSLNRGVEGDANLPTGLGVFGINAAVTGNSVGIQGQSASPNGLSVIGITNTSLGNPAAATVGYGVYGQANGPAAITGTLIGVRGSSNTSITSGAAIGVYGSSASLTGFGMQAFNSNASGTGIIVSGNNAAATYIVTGSGAAINGSALGTFSRATAAGSTGILAASNGAGLTTIVGGSGVSGSSTRFGVVGWAAGGPAATNRTGGYFDCNAGASYAYIGMLDAANIAWKINGNGLVGTIVKDLNENKVSMVCPESPEVLFQDYGQGQLTNGSAHITIDPVFSRNIIVNEAHPLKVFIQLKGDCKGVYVSNETANGFDVTELQNGNSNAKFNWMISANRADETLSDGSVAKYSTLRFSPASGPAQSASAQSGTRGSSIENAAGILQNPINPKSLNKNQPEK